METHLAVLSDSDTAKHGRRYSDIEKEAAYLLWRIECGRSARKTADRCGIDRDTLNRWIATDDWRARADAEDVDDFGAMRIAAVAMVTNHVAPAIEKMAYLMQHAKDEKVQADAAKWLAGLGGVSPVSKIEQAVTDHSRTAAVDVLPDFASMSHDELRAYEDAQRKKRTRHVTARQS